MGGVYVANIYLCGMGWGPDPRARRHESHAFDRSCPWRRCAPSCLAASAAFAGLVLTGCASDDATGTGSAFTQALGKNYSDLGNQAAALPVPPEEGDEGIF